MWREIGMWVLVLTVIFIFGQVGFIWLRGFFPRSSLCWVGTKSAKLPPLTKQRRKQRELWRTETGKEALIWNYWNSAKNGTENDESQRSLTPGGHPLPGNATRNWSELAKAYNNLAQPGTESSLKRPSPYWSPMRRNILPRITAGIIVSALLTITWIRRSRPALL